MDIKKTRKWVLPAGILVAGLVYAEAGQSGRSVTKNAATETTSETVQSQTADSPAPTVAPDVTVNGQKVPQSAAPTEVPIPGGKAHVEVSGGHTRITTSSSGTSGDTSNQQSGNVDININSQSSGGTNWGSTQIYNYNSSSDNSSTSVNSTSTFSSSSN